MCWSFLGLDPNMEVGCAPGSDIPPGPSSEWTSPSPTNYLWRDFRIHEHLQDYQVLTVKVGFSFSFVLQSYRFS